MRDKSDILFWLTIFMLKGMPPAWAQEEAIDIRDIKLPLAYPINYKLIIVLLTIAIFLFLIWYLIKKWPHQKKKIAKANVPPPLPPWEIALKKLQLLIDDNLPASGQLKEYFSRLSDIVRQYIEGRFELRAPEMTTPEFLEAMNRTQKLEVAHKEILRDFLACCDMVKFAKYGPSEKEIEEGARITERFIVETKPVEKDKT